MSALNTQHSAPNSRIGFTLVELSIVLVIIALMGGAVLVGRTMIETLTRMKAIKNVEEFNLATMAFKQKFNCLPGDCTAAQSNQFALTPHPNTYYPATNNGNNNGKVCERGASVALPLVLNSTQRYECRNYWWHLSQLEMINWSMTPNSGQCFTGLLLLGQSTPPIPFLSPPAIEDASGRCPGWMIVGPGEMNIGSNPFANQNHAFLIMSRFANSGAINSGALSTGLETLTPSEAFYLDTKLDDGLPMSGKVRAIGFYQDVSQPSANRDLTAPYRGNPGLAVCINDSVTPNLYNVTNNLRTCNLSIEASF